MFFCLQTLLARLGNLTYSLLFVPQGKLCSFSLSCDDLGLEFRPVLTASWKDCSRIFICCRYSTRLLRLLLYSPHLWSLLPHQLTGRQCAPKYVLEMNVQSSCFHLWTLCSLLLHAKLNPRRENAEPVTACVPATPSQCLFCSNAGFPNPGPRGVIS